MLLPEKALSIRQPWAHAIVFLGKSLENRNWGNIHASPNKRFRGPICIHASSGMTRDEYEDAKAFMARFGVVCPPPADLVRGAIIGTAKVIGWVTSSQNNWWMGPGALVLDDIKPADPIPCKGELGFFNWKRSGEIQPVKPWMLPEAKDEPPLLAIADKRQGEML